MENPVITKDQIEKAANLISKSKRVVITCHRSPDGDAIGSSLALFHYLKNKVERARVVIPDPDPDFLHWTPGHDQILIFETQQEEAEEEVEKADLIFSLDYNTLKRTGDLASSLEKALDREVPFILIDHHQQPEDYPKVLISDTQTCSTAQLIYEFIVGIDGKTAITSEIGQCLYLGIMTDTGSFRFPSVEPKTHRIVADLLERGVEHALIHQEVYDTNLEDRLKLVGHALRNKLIVNRDLHMAYISLSKEELDDHNYRKGDTEGLVNQALSVKGVNFAAFIREGNNEVKMSFRSRGTFDVNQFARKYFDGGGHKNAAGGISDKSLEETISNFEQAAAECQSELNY
ncbi:DHH family phosphoesterase [Halocola ammonii]